ncbi:MAG: hypothetical protein ACI8S6_004022 [Myxococcota bacterium]|jgi:hypothetical protein
MLAEKKRRWDRRQSNGNEKTWLVLSAVAATVLGLAIVLA